MKWQNKSLEVTLKLSALIPKRFRFFSSSIKIWCLFRHRFTRICCLWSVNYQKPGNTLDWRSRDAWNPIHIYIYEIGGLVYCKSCADWSGLGLTDRSSTPCLFGTGRPAFLQEQLIKKNKNTVKNLTWVTWQLSCHIIAKLRPCPLMSLALVGAAVLDSVLVNALEVKGLGVTGGGAGQQSLPPFSHEPPAGFSSHVSGHVLLHPALSPGVKPLVQTRAHALVRLRERKSVRAVSRCDDYFIYCYYFYLFFFFFNEQMYILFKVTFLVFSWF